MKILSAENIKANPRALGLALDSISTDMRSTLNWLQLWGAKLAEQGPIYQRLSVTAKDKAKPLIFTLGFQLFNTMATVESRFNLFNSDEFYVSCWVHENYPKTTPKAIQDAKAKNNSIKSIRILELDLLSKAADCLSLGDVVYKEKYLRGNWTAQNAHANLSCTIPATLLKGTPKSDFPTVMGKNSQINSRLRLLATIQSHVQVEGRNPNEAVLNRVPILKQRLASFLKKGKVNSSLLLKRASR